LAVPVERPDGTPLDRLGADDFEVFENGVLQPIAYFGSSDVPVDLVLMLDTSGSMAAHLPVTRTAAVELMKALGPRDRVAVVAFGTRTDVMLPFTGARAAVEAAIRRIRIGGTTALYDALYITLRQFGVRSAQSAFRRRAMVVLTDGDDTTSLMGFDAVLDEARRAGIAIFMVGLREGQDPAARRFSQLTYEIRTLARETGARHFFPADQTELRAVYQSIASELTHQYALAYVSPNAGPDHDRAAYRRVLVSVDEPGPGVVVRTRLGYISTSPASPTSPVAPAAD
ncbi:MAG: VWA domain-containing protein, partial [Vicinamibacterales bacterium]